MPLLSPRLSDPFALHIPRFIISLTILCLAHPGSLSAQSSALPAEQGAGALLKQMTVEEKIGQLNQAAGILKPEAPPAEEQVRKGLAGSVLWVSEVVQ